MFTKIRDFLHKSMPKHEYLIRHKHLKFLGDALENPELWQFKKQSVSRGVFVGVLVAFIPLPIQMLLASVLAVLARGNIIVACACTWITNPFTLLPIKYSIYKVGQIIINDTTQYTSEHYFDWHGKDLSEIISLFWQWFKIAGETFLIGLPVVSITAACCAYCLVILVWWFAEHISTRQKAKRP